MRRSKSYSHCDSPFYRLNSKSKLAALLFIGQNKLKELSTKHDHYFSFQKKKKNGGFRQISAPRDDLKKVQKRIADLLQRLKTPDYLYAPVQGRSYVDNAAVHIDAKSIRLLDIDDFFPSCKANKVIWFFRTRMQCSEDVAVILKNIVTRNDTLPQGSPCSPILAYLCYGEMWDEIETLVKNSQCRLSVYADDITISGNKIPEKMIWEIKIAMHRHGHNISVDKERRKINKPAEITGVIVTRSGMFPPNRQQKSIIDVKKKIVVEKKALPRNSLINELKGRTAQVNQIRRHPKQPA